MKRFTKLSNMLLLLLITAWTQTSAQALGDVTGDGANFFTEERALKASDIIPGKTIIIKSVNNDQKGRWFGLEKNSTNHNRYSSDNLSDANYFIVEGTIDEAEGQFVLKRKSDGKYLTRPVTNLTTDKSQAIAFKAVNPSGNFAPADTYYPAWDTPSNGQYTYLVRFVTADGQNFLNVNNSELFGPNSGNGSWTAFYVLDPEKEVSPYPFLLSDAPTADGFAENTHWYYLKLNNRYLAYNDVEETYNYSGSNNKTQKFIYSYASNPVTYGSFWAFVKDGDDLKIYNAATGTSQVLSSDGNAERTNYPSMQAINANGYTQSWHYKIAKNNTNFYLFLQDNNGNYANSVNKLNCYGNSTEGNPNNYLTFSIGDGDWSYLGVEAVNVTAAINSVKEKQALMEGVVGALTGSSYTDFTAALKTGSMEGLVEALKIRDLTGETIKFDPNKLYRLQNVKFGGIFGINPESMSLKKETAMDPSNANLLFKFEEGSNGNVKIYHPNAKLYVGTAGSGESVPLKDASEASEYTKLDWGAGNFGFMNASNLDIVQLGENGNIALYSNSDGAGKGGDHAWYLIPAEEIDVNITAAGYATVNYPFAVQVPAGIKAYTGSLSAEKNVLNLNEIADGIIPANTPVVLEGAEGTYSLTILADNITPAIEGNALKGVLLSQEIVADKKAYVLGNVSTVGFYKVAANDRILAANKAYIELPAATAQGIRSITIGGPTTGIEDTVTEGTETEEYYDLQGRRVLNPTKGIYVTKSGKKVLFNK